MKAAGARLVGLTKRYDDVVALDDVSLAIEPGELLVVVGPSGCGKSTLLRLVAGLESLSSGEVHIGDRRVDALPPQERDVAMVFQSYALYPHMTVRRNIEFPLRMRRFARGERRRRAEEVAALLEIAPLLDRRPSELSGGQRQRVALARALVRQPALFLLDEPLSNLDARLRTNVRRHIRDVQRELGVTTLYVTHDQTEAMTLAHRMVVLDGGRVQTVATPDDAYSRPENAFVARFLGTPPMSLLTGHVEGDRLRVGDQELALPPERVARMPGGPVLVGMRPEAIVPIVRAGAAFLRVTPRPETVENLGSEVLLLGRVGEEEVSIRSGPADVSADAFAAPVEALHFFSSVDGRRLGP